MKFIKAFFTLFLVIAGGIAQAQNVTSNSVTLDYYLPDSVSYDASIPTPEDVIGIIPGEWHVRHDQLLRYMRALAKASDRVAIHKFGETYEGRDLVYLTITAPANHTNIEQIREQHLKLANAEASDQLNVEDMPVVLYLGYSIHGDEPSGVNASMITAYHLSAAQGADIEQTLQNSVILLDPSYNPDGGARFAGWVNSFRSRSLNTDPNAMEHNQRWPSGRTNHYFFDLNRDWMPVQHPASRGRIATFHKWKPNVLTDHHEMGSNSTFFFQPGIPTRTHPLTPDRNQELTQAIARYHAKFLDRQERMYYSEESYDDFYYGKGSTYPDINGTIGILFEQAGSNGHAIETIHGVMSFPFTVKNHFTASLSTIAASQDLRVELLNYQRNFFQEAGQEANESEIRAYVYGMGADEGRTYELTQILARQNVEVYHLNKKVEANGYTFTPEEAFIIPVEQQQYRFIEALFERRTEFPDSLFYDVSAWTMQYAFNMPFAELEGNFSNDLMGAPVEGLPAFPEGEMIGGKAKYAYMFAWDEYYAPRTVNRLLKHDVLVKVAEKPFTAKTAGGLHEFDYGTILVPLAYQSVDADKIYELLKKGAQNDALEIYAVSTGLTPQGMDLGSESFGVLKKPEVAVIAGEGTRSYEVGQVWHLLDWRYHMTPTLLTKEQLSDEDLNRYNVMVMVAGYYGNLSKETVDKVKDWVSGGGTLVATKSAIRWAKNAGLADIEFVKEQDEDSTITTKPYALMRRYRGAQYIGGAIFHAKLDLTHPLGYGFNNEDVPVFRNSRLFMKMAENPYATPLYYTDEPLASGYISDDNLAELKGTAAIVVSSYGRGTVITMTDNPNFRAFWFGTNKLFTNAIFFGHIIRL